MNAKYPRTYHIPWSPGATSDDKRLDDLWFYEDQWKDVPVIITEKLDGEGVHFTNEDVFCRSDSEPTRSPWSQNLWDGNGLLWKIKNIIGANEVVYGENLYGEHSIHYDKLPSYFFMFSAKDESGWYSWYDVETMAKLLDVPTVPVLWKGVLEDERELKNIIDKFMAEPSAFGDTKEGVVIRKAEGFTDFTKSVCKYVRANHVQTDRNWTRNWKKAELCV